MHERVRRQHWGYAPDERMPNTELISERYRGIRPAPGYPACPDHTEKQTLWRLLDVQANTGIELTESMAMWPGASVSGWYFSHPDSQYFVVGRIGRDQVVDYAARKGWTLEPRPSAGCPPTSATRRTTDLALRDGARTVGWRRGGPAMSEPELRDPIVLAAFEGWNDAAEAASGALAHLHEVWDAQPLVAIDPEEYHDFQVTRPQVSLEADGRRRITWPATRLSWARPPGSDRDVVLVRGIEPSMRWRRYTDELLGT